MRPVENWDPDYLLEIAASTETARLEKKASAKFDLSKKADLKEEIAKQVCAFANSGGGFLIFGIDKNGNLDGGVETKVGKLPVKEWVEAEIPTLVLPATHGCEARLIVRPQHHAPDRGVLVISIPLSDLRPHWVPGKPQGSPDQSYIRAGEHSRPMGLQTFLDISNRNDAPRVAIESLAGATGPVRKDHKISCWINPEVKLLSGPCCELWAVEIRVSSKGLHLRYGSGANMTKELVEGRDVVLIRGSYPLFPGKLTGAVVGGPLTLEADEHVCTGKEEVTVTLYADSAKPVIKNYLAWDIFNGKV